MLRRAAKTKLKLRKVTKCCGMVREFTYAFRKNFLELREWLLKICVGQKLRKNLSKYLRNVRE